MPIRVLKFTKCTKFYKNTEISSPSELEISKKLVISTLSEPTNIGYKNKLKKFYTSTLSVLT